MLGRVGFGEHKMYAVGIWEEVLQFGEGGGGVYRYPRLSSGVFDLMNYPVRVNGGFHVKGYAVAAGLNERVDVTFGMLNHEMGIQREFGACANGANGVQPEAQLRGEMSVHNIEVYFVNAAALKRADVLGERRQIGVAYGGGPCGLFHVRLR